MSACTPASTVARLLIGIACALPALKPVTSRPAAGRTQSGRRFRLKGKGMPVLRSGQTGDMYVEVAVETPQKLTRRQRELLREFEK